MECPTCGKPKMRVIALQLCAELYKQGYRIAHVTDVDIDTRRLQGLSLMEVVGDWCDKQDETF